MEHKHVRARKAAVGLRTQRATYIPPGSSNSPPQWDVVGFDAYISLSLGRPPCFSTVHVDVQLPEDSEMGDDSDGDKQQSCTHPLRALILLLTPGPFAVRGRWHPFTRDILLKVMDETSGVAPLPYATVLRLDRLVREHRFSETLQFTDSSKQGISETLALQRAFAFVMTQKRAPRHRLAILVLMRAAVLLYLHRSFFAYAINETAEDPLKSQYAQSVLAAFRGAVYITSSARALYKRIPLSVRLWMFWSHAFSAAVSAFTGLSSSARLRGADYPGRNRHPEPELRDRACGVAGARPRLQPLRAARLGVPAHRACPRASCAPQCRRMR